MALNLYVGEPQHENFPRMDSLFPTRNMAPSNSPFQFPDGPPIDQPEAFSFDDQLHGTEQFLTETDTSALLVLHKGVVWFEWYMLTGGRDVRWISWSVAKSFVSALIGVAVEEGLIDSTSEPITKYVPVLADSAYAGVSVKDVLQMSSGARWNEDYSDPNSDIHCLGSAMAGDSSMADFVSRIEQAASPGTVCQYNSADTPALGMLLVAAAGCPISDYMQEKLCEPLGMESPGYLIVDSAGMEMALGGLNLTARDFAKIGELYRNNDVWGGNQIVPQAWVAASIIPDAPHLEPGRVIVGGHIFLFGYGYQWWVPQGQTDEFSAIGVYNQFVYVDPSRDVVIVKLSANRAYGTSADEATIREEQTLELLRAIDRQLDGTATRRDGDDHAAVCEMV